MKDKISWSVEEAELSYRKTFCLSRMKKPMYKIKNYSYVNISL